ncbi:MAG: metalloregulator ArsR/SmtB family transcription factor [Verrucomicrobiota bacterium]
MDRPALEHVALMFRAFAEATRLAILQELKTGPLSVNQLVTNLDTSQANISKQLRILHDAELLHREKIGTQVFYQIKDETVFQLCELVCDKLNRDARAKSPFDFSI